MTEPGKAIVFGKALLDPLPDCRVGSGTPLKVAVHLARLGWQVALTKIVEPEAVPADGDDVLMIRVKFA